MESSLQLMFPGRRSFDYIGNIEPDIDNAILTKFPKINYAENTTEMSFLKKISKCVASLKHLFLILIDNLLSINYIC